jgi:hypothetical protein
MEEAIVDKQNNLSRKFCPNCEKECCDKSYPKCRAENLIDNFPLFLFILFGISYEDLKLHKEKIKNFIMET